MSRRKHRTLECNVRRKKGRTKAPNLTENLFVINARDCDAPRRSFNGGHYAPVHQLTAFVLLPCMLSLSLHVHAYRWIEKGREKGFCVERILWAKRCMYVCMYVRACICICIVSIPCKICECRWFLWFICLIIYIRAQRFLAIFTFALFFVQKNERRRLDSFCATLERILSYNVEKLVSISWK